MTDRRKNLEQDVAETGDTDIEEKINSILAEIAEIEKQIRDASAESQELLKRISRLAPSWRKQSFLRIGISLYVHSMALISKGYALSLMEKRKLKDTSGLQRVLSVKQK